jgi:hypothetical protein
MIRNDPIKSIKKHSLEERCMICPLKNKLPSPQLKETAVIIGGRSSFSNTGGFSVSGKTRRPVSIE